MRKFLLAIVLALAALAVLPDRSHAWGRDNYSAHGFGWLGSLAFRHKQWIHQDGPLYNYGPYNGGQGYVDMHIPRPWHGMYTPADVYYLFEVNITGTLPGITPDTPAIDVTGHFQITSLPLGG